MSITYTETLGSTARPSSGALDALASSPGVVRPRVIVERYTPDFGVTQYNRNTTGTTRAKGDPFDACYDQTHHIFMRAFINGTNAYIDDMPLSDTNWRYIDQPISTAGGAMAGIAPKVIYNTAVGIDGYFQVFYLGSDGRIYYFQGSDAVTGASGAFTPAISFSSYGTVEHISAVQVVASPHVYIYLVIKRTAGNDTNTRMVYVYYSGNGQVYDTGIRWGQALTGFDVISANSLNNSSNHILFMSTETPCTFTFKQVSGTTPQKEAQHAGGVISFIVTIPQPAAGKTNILVSRYYPVHVFDNVTSVQYRKTVKAGWANVFSNVWELDGTARSRSRMWIATSGRDGDLNVGDVSNYYEAIFLYSSADGKHWSQDYIIPGLSAGVGEFDGVGARLIVAENYVYLISTRFTYRSKGCAMFHNTHADNGLEITRRMINLSMDWNEGRSTTITLDNKDTALTSTILGTPCTLKLTTYIGDGTGHVQVSVQEVDTTAPSRQQPNEYMELNARDRLSWLNDRVVSPDAQTFDNYTLAVDNFANIAGQVNTGLAHTAVVAGAMGTNNNRLFSLPNFKESIAFSTFQNNIESFMAHTLFKFYPPSFLAYVGGVLGQTPSSSNAPTYAGIIFYAADKDNFWFVRYNYWTSRIEFGKRVAGATTVLDSQNPGAGFVASANGGAEVGLRIEVKDCVVRVYWATGTGSRDFTYQATEYCKGAGTNETPLLKGYVGLMACGYSDEDQVTQEFGSTALLGLPS